MSADGTPLPLSPQPLADCEHFARCPRCELHGITPPPLLIVINSRVRESHRVQYLGCKRCGYRPPNNKRIIPLTFAPPQPPRT